MAASFTVHPFLIFFTFFVFFASLHVPKTIVTALSKPQKGYRMQLIHRDSPLSPFHNPKSTLTDRAKWAFESSISRYAYLSMKQNATAHGAHMDALKPSVVPDYFDYLAKLSVGTPPVDIYLIIDTASEFLWTQCEPCVNCFPQRVPRFDPRKSSTYSNVSCDAPACKFLRYKLCKPTCIYHYTYVDGSESFGLVGKDVLTFKSSSGSIATLPNVTFGCGSLYNKMRARGHQTGVLGLAAAEISLVPSLETPKFSFCVGNLSDPSSVGNLILGEEALITPIRTPMVQKGLYYVKLLDISFGNKKLGLPTGTFELAPSGTGGVYLDSATKMTFLPPNAYDKLIGEIKEELNLHFHREPLPDPEGEGKFCFRGMVSEDLIGYPDITFHFDGNANMILEEGSIFLQVTGDVYCIAFLRGGPGGLTVIGNLAQQYYNFGYDLVNNVLSFQLMDCNSKRF